MALHNHHTMEFVLNSVEPHPIHTHLTFLHYYTSTDNKASMIDS